MENPKPGIMEDDQGNPSSMRFMCVVSLIAAIAFGAITLLHSDTGSQASGVQLTVFFLVGAFAPKAVQKFAESRFKS